jgi:hypothetical protein
MVFTDRSYRLYIASSQFLSFVQLLVPSPCSAHHCACHRLSSQIVILQSVQFHHCSSLLPVQLTTVPVIWSAHSLQFCNLFSFTTARPYSLFSSPLCLPSDQLTDCNSAICSVPTVLFPALCSAHHCACHLISSQFAILQSVQLHHCSSLLSAQLTTVTASCSAHSLQFCNLFSFTTALPYSLFSSPLCLPSVQHTIGYFVVCSSLLLLPVTFLLLSSSCQMAPLFTSSMPVLTFF